MRLFEGIERHIDRFLEKRGAVSWNPVNWFADASKNPGVGYGMNFGDFWRPLGKNLKSAPARAGQVLSHGGTDLVSGSADTFGAHDFANSVRKWQKGMDDTYDGMMGPEMREEYRNNKFGRMMGDMSSAAIGAALTAGVGSKIRVGGAIGQGLSRLNDPVLRAAGNGLTKMSPSVGRALLAGAGQYVHTRGASPENRLSANEGDVNPWMRMQDLANLHRMKTRMEFGHDREMGQYLPTYEWYDRTYKPQGENDGMRQMTVRGRPVYYSDGKGRPSSPIYVSGSNEQKRLDSYLHSLRKYHEAKAVGPVASSWYGAVAGYPQARFNEIPGIVSDGKGGFQFIPKPKMTMGENGRYEFHTPSMYELIGGDLDRKLGTKNLYRAGGAVSLPIRGAAYMAMPITSALGDMYNGSVTGNGVETGMGFATAASNMLLPGSGKAVASIANPAVRMAARFGSTAAPLLAGGTAGYLLSPPTSPDDSPYAERFRQEIGNLRQGKDVTPGYFTTSAPPPGPVK